MFIDTGMILRLAVRRSAMFAPMNARLAMFRSSGARRIFLNLYSINISSLWDEELCRTLTSSYITPEKQTLLVCCKGQQKQEQSTKFKVLSSKYKDLNPRPSLEQSRLQRARSEERRVGKECRS